MNSQSEEPWKWMTTQKVVDDLTAGVEEKEGGEELVEEEDNDECTELTRRELAENGEESGEGEVEGGEGSDSPGGEGKGGALLWLWIPHVGHGQCEHPPRICHSGYDDVAHGGHIP